MTPEQFCYWLQGFSELSPTGLCPAQWKKVQDHLQTVFKKVTPAYVPAVMPPYEPNPFEKYKFPKPEFMC